MDRHKIQEIREQGFDVDVDDLVQMLEGEEWERDDSDLDMWGDVRALMVGELDELLPSRNREGRTPEEIAADDLWLHDLTTSLEILKLNLTLSLEDGALWVTQTRILFDDFPAYENDL